MPGMRQPTPNFERNLHMRVRQVLPALLLGAGLLALVALPVTADTEKPATSKANAEKIAKLIEQLGSESFKERKAASEALDKIGGPALEALRKAAKSKDVETSKRARE